MVLTLMTYIFTNVCDVHQKGMPNERWNVYWIGCWIMIWFNTGTVANMFSTKSKGTIIIIIIKDAIELNLQAMSVPLYYRPLRFPGPVCLCLCLCPWWDWSALKGGRSRWLDLYVGVFVFMYVCVCVFVFVFVCVCVCLCLCLYVCPWWDWSALKGGRSRWLDLCCCIATYILFSVLASSSSAYFNPSLQENHHHDLIFGKT